MTVEKEYIKLIFGLKLKQARTNKNLSLFGLAKITDLSKSYLNESSTEMADFPVSPGTLSELIELVETQVISHSTATQKAFPALIQEPQRAPRELAEANNWLQNRNTNELETLVNEVLQAMPDKVAAYQKGKKGLMGLFVGEVMKKSKGNGDPKMINQLLAEKLR